jgi:hypothetical protein
VVLKASIAYAVGVIGTSAALLSVVGVAAIGVGWAVGSVVLAVVLARAVRRLADADIIRPLLRPLGAALLGGVVGWWIASSASNHLLGGMAGGAVASLLTTAVLALLSREYLADLSSVVAHSARSALTREGKEVSQAS